MTTTKLYPALDESPNAENFRLTEILNIRSDLESQIEKYNRCESRYKAVFKILNNFQFGFETVTTVGAGSSVVTLMTGVGAPVSVVLAGLSAGIGGLGFINHLVLKRLLKKIQKHIAILTLTESKLHSINILTNKALTDGKISEQEYSQILEDYTDFKTKKEKLRNLKIHNKKTFLANNQQVITELNDRLALLFQKAGTSNK